MAGISTPALSSSGSGSTTISNLLGMTTLGQKTMSASLAVVIASDQSAISATQSGTWNINNISGTISLPTGAATAAKQPALGTAGTPSADVITIQGITSMTAVKVDGSAVTQPVSGTFWQATQPVSNAGTFAVQAAQSGTWNINNISGTISLPTGAATEATLTKLPIAQGTALGTNSGPMIQGSVTTNAPTYTTGNINPVSLTTAGGLRIDLKDTAANTNNLNVNLAASAATVTVSATNLSTNIAQMNGVTVAMNTGAVSTGTQRVVLANDAGKTLVSKSGSASTSGNNTLVAAGTNKLKVYAFSLSTQSTTAMTCKFQDGASGTDLWSVILQAGTSVSTGANLAVTPPAYLFTTSAATLLNLNLSSANAVQWSVAYYEEA